MKGNVIIGQSGGPTAVINSSLAGAVKASWKYGIRRIYGMRHGIEGLLQEDIVDIEDYITSGQDLSLLKRTPSSFLGTCRYKLPPIEGNEKTYEKIFDILERMWEGARQACKLLRSRWYRAEHEKFRVRRTRAKPDGKRHRERRICLFLPRAHQ